MKKSVCCLLPLLAVGAALPARAAAEKPAIREEKKELRVLAATPEHRVVVGHTLPKEKVTFLGVGTMPVSATLAAQLGLAKGSGLVVQHIVPDSAAVNVLQEHDILLKLDDQILIETRQLEVLIRNHKEGDEVTLTYLRGGKQATARVKLGQKEVPKVSVIERRIPLGLRAPGAEAGLHVEGFEMAAPPPGQSRAEYDDVLSLIRPGSGQSPVRINIGRREGQGLRATSVNIGNSNLVFSDDQGSLDLTIKDGQKTLVAKDAKGQQIFSGPVTSPEERRAMPEAVRRRLEHLEGMHDVTFRTDGDFSGGGGRVLHGVPRNIALPHPAPMPRSPSASPSF